MDEVKSVARVPTVEDREPCELRGSRTVLGAPGAGTLLRATRRTTWLPSSCAEEFHLRALPEPYVNLWISHGSRCSAVGTRATGFTSSTGSSCCQWPQLARGLG